MNLSTPRRTASWIASHLPTCIPRGSSVLNFHSNELGRELTALGYFETYRVGTSPSAVTGKYHMILYNNLLRNESAYITTCGESMHNFGLVYINWRKAKNSMPLGDIVRHVETTPHIKLVSFAPLSVRLPGYRNFFLPEAHLLLRYNHP